MGISSAFSRLLRSEPRRRVRPCLAVQMLEGRTLLAAQGPVLSVPGGLGYAWAADQDALDLGASGTTDSYTVELSFYVADAADDAYVALVNKPGAYRLTV